MSNRTGALVIPRTEVTMAEILRVNDGTTRAEIEAMLLVLRGEQKRAPGCMGERYHERYDALLGDWMAAPA